MSRKNRGFCNRYQPKSKPARKYHWGNKLLAGLNLKGGNEKGISNFTPPSGGCQVSETPT
ncbi:hypothetical protein [Kamptonema sp. PCC 6506]|uniref:hypothetical protein n=1 Tax=Kamptonema sp. PCC 6506 TaxID=272129 RepID=UPI0012F5216F|nr:hypothetical protein [Kamptonema sp. PCC 6506]